MWHIQGREIFIPADLRTASGNSLLLERTPRNVPGTFSTHKTPGKDEKKLQMKEKTKKKLLDDKVYLEFG